LKDPSLHYTWFDFHGECKKMKWENLSKLLKIVEEQLIGHGYFLANLEVGMD
jgi:phosphatidylinositol 4-phosphatase